MNAHICFVLVETTHSGNIGAAARAMKTMGFEHLRLVAPCKYLTNDALARASGADQIVTSAEVFPTLAQAVSDCTLVFGTSARPRSLESSVSLLEDAARDIATVDGDVNFGTTAIVFGRERSGLTNEELALCQRRLSIPANPHFSSLNLGSAVQVVAYEIRKALQGQASLLSEGVPVIPDAAGSAVQNEHTADDPTADNQSVEQFFEHLQRVMIKTEFLNPDNPRLLMRRIRRLFNRSRLRKSEIQILRGILSAVEKRLS